jgi:plasmid stability protein
MVRKRTDIIKLQLRLTEGLRRRIEHAADNNRRSMNTEIIERLTNSFRGEDQVALTARAAQKVVEILIGRVEDPAEKQIAQQFAARFAQLSTTKKEDDDGKAS